MTGDSARPARRSQQHHGTSRKASSASQAAGISQTAVDVGQIRGSERTVPGGAGPDPRDVVAAVESLYYDGLQPYGRILRKRLMELSTARGEASLDIGSAHLRVVCE